MTPIIVSALPSVTRACSFGLPLLPARQHTERKPETSISSYLLSITDLSRHNCAT